jgi:preprotein translocase subunit SecG
MYILIVIIHLFVCAILMAAVLLQSGKGAEMGAAFGGSSQTIFGSRGSATFLSKLTVVAAITFMVTSLSLSILTRERSVASGVIDTGTKEEAVPKEKGVPGGPVTIPTDPSTGAAPTQPEGSKPAEGSKPSP